MEYENRISIGKDLYIKSGPIPPDWDKSIPIDDILSPIQPFLSKFEVNCVAGCCGIDAYQFWPDDIIRALDSDTNSLLHTLRDVRESLTELPDVLFMSERINYYFKKSVLIKLLDHIINVIESSPNKTIESTP